MIGTGFSYESQISIDMINYPQVLGREGEYFYPSSFSHLQDAAAIQVHSPQQYQWKSYCCKARIAAYVYRPVGADEK